MIDRIRDKPLGLESHPLAASLILLLTTGLGTLLLIKGYLGELHFIALLTLGLGGAVVAYIGADFRMFKAGPSGVELERFSAQAINARDEAVELAKIVARVAVFDAFGDPRITHHGPIAKLRIAWLEHTLSELNNLGSDDEDAQQLLQLLREIEAGIGDPPEGTDKQIPEDIKAFEDYWARHNEQHNAITKRYINLLDSRIDRKDLSDAAIRELKPREPKEVPKRGDK